MKKDIVYLTVPKLERWQHYRDRRPPWMKLHVEIFDNYDFTCLPDKVKYHLLAIWLLATQIDNKVPYDIEWIQRKICSVNQPDIDMLLREGHLEIHEDSAVLSGRKQSAIAETETETETEYTSESSSKDSRPRKNNIPFSRIVDLYHEILPELPKVEKLTTTRKGFIRQRWNEDMSEIEHWRNYFQYVRKSDFLMGKVEPNNGRPPFRADLEWLTRPGNFAKIAEDKYHRV